MTRAHHRRTGYEEKFSTEYCITRALSRGMVSLDHLTNTQQDKKCESLIPKINLINPHSWGVRAVDLLTEISIQPNTLKTYSYRVAIQKGKPKNSMTEGNQSRDSSSVGGRH